MTQAATLSVGGQSFSGLANLGHPTNGSFDLDGSDVGSEEIHVGMTGKLEVHLSGTHVVQITRRDGPRVRFKILT